MNYSENENDVVIQLKGISKDFILYNRKRDKILDLVSAGKKRRCKIHRALDKIDLKIKKGESVAIVGKNGSGKSTLLQIICKTLSATRGTIEINGKVAALLELGSGFDLNFTGRENIYINGLLLGLSNEKIKEKMNTIISFAEIEEFIDQPVKTYSSGMIVRLAFAIMTNVEADILVIDEALAVGDAYFTQKCMRYIQRFRKNGTIVFVSHDASAVMSLCDRAILLDKGQNVMTGSPEKVIKEYTKAMHNIASTNAKSISDSQNRNEEKNPVILKEIDEEDYVMKWTDYRTRLINQSSNMNTISIASFDTDLSDEESYGGTLARITKVDIKRLDDRSSSSTILKGGELVKLSITLESIQRIENIICGFLIKNDKGLTLAGDNTSNTLEDHDNLVARVDEIMKADFVFTMPLLPSGEYSITVSIATGNLEKHSILHWVNDAIILTSQCSSIAAGLAGLPIQSMRVNTYKR